MLVELVIHLPSREQKAGVQREFTAREGFALSWGKKKHPENTVARSDEHPQLQLKLEAAMRSRSLYRKETGRRWARKSGVWVGCGLGPLLTAIGTETHVPTLVYTR